jgi:hypothetical protein
VLGDLTVDDPLEVRVPDREVLPVGTNTRSMPPSAVHTTKSPVWRPDIRPKVTTRPPSTTSSSVVQVRSL